MWRRDYAIATISTDLRDAIVNGADMDRIDQLAKAVSMLHKVSSHHQGARPGTNGEHVMSTLLRRVQCVPRSTNAGIGGFFVEEHVHHRRAGHGGRR